MELTLNISLHYHPSHLSSPKIFSFIAPSNSEVNTSKFLNWINNPRPDQTRNSVGTQKKKKKYCHEHVSPNCHITLALKLFWTMVVRFSWFSSAYIVDEFWFRSQEEIAREAINHAIRALRKRHLVEEAAHTPAFIALSRPFVSQVTPSLMHYFSVIFLGLLFVLGSSRSRSYINFRSNCSFMFHMNTTLLMGYHFFLANNKFCNMIKYYVVGNGRLLSNWCTSVVCKKKKCSVKTNL